MIGKIDNKEIDMEFLCNYLKIDEVNMVEEAELMLYANASKNYILKRIGCTEEYFYTSDILQIPYLMLVADMYANKETTQPTYLKTNAILDRFFAVEGSIM